jgi:ParB family transcriptional regulator, chromosome partitioning protein
MPYSFADTRDIPLDELVIGQSQARVRHVDKGIEDLATSISKLGLLEPIVVQKLDDGKYEIVTGQRRFLAHRLLLQRGMLPNGSIKAQILAEQLDPIIAKAISLTENMVREDMASSDYIDACTELFRRYGSIKAVSEELGLPKAKVSQYVKFDQLVGDLKTMVTNGSIEMDVALRAQKAATSEDGTVNEEKALLYAKEMLGMSGVQAKAFEKIAHENPEESVENIIEKGRKQPKIKQVVITIQESEDDALNTFAQEEGTSKGDAASSLIVSGLTEKGYLAE